jgi:hypothetical protein
MREFHGLDGQMKGCLDGSLSRRIEAFVCGGVASSLAELA